MKKLLVSLCFFAVPSYATVILDTTSVSDITNVTVGYSSFTITLGDGINRAVVVGCETNAAPPDIISSVTVGGILAVRAGATGGSLDRAELWTSTGNAAGLNQIMVYLPGTYRNDITMCGASSWENVNQTTPVNISSGMVNNTSVTFTTTLGTTALVDVTGQGTTPAADTPNSGQTLLWAIPYHDRSTVAEMSWKSGGTSAGSKTMGWTITSNNAMQALALNTAAGAPDMTTISPATKGIGTGSFTLTVNGANFVSGATVTWNGANRVTSFVSSTQLTAVILSTDVVNIGLYPIRVINPDTSRSNIVNFNLTGDITYIWATDGGYKVSQDDLYGTLNTSTVTNTRIYDGNTIRPFQAKNELNGFALVLENNTTVNTSTVSVTYPVLTGPGGYVISSTPAVTSTLWDWRNRPIELYYVRYLRILGLSTLEWDTYDETHVPERFQATYTLNGNQGVRTGNWTSRADHDKAYPEILVPMEAVVGSTFAVQHSSSQIIWVDIYVPKEAPAGLYTGSVSVYEGAQVSTTVPISLTVYPFTMPDTPSSKVMAYTSLANINQRMGGYPYPTYGGITSSETVTRTRWYQELHRMGITPIGDAQQAGCGSLIADGPCPEFQIQLDGSLYSPTSGYANAPGILTGEPLYMMFAYGAWRGTTYWPYTYAATCSNANIWVNWFQTHAPKSEFYWYLEDEAVDLTNNNTYSTWVTTCPAPGNQLNSFATVAPQRIAAGCPNLMAFATTQELGIAATEEAGVQAYTTNARKRAFYYNGSRPWNGTLMTDDDGIAMRVMQWMQYKKKFDHYFIWETTNYTSGANVQNDLFHDAKTFGYYTSDSSVFGRTGFSYNNGDGVLLYPGTDYEFPADSYGAPVPFPSYRLMMFRRGINDFTYLTLASHVDAKIVDATVQSIIPKVLWEYGVVDTGDPTYQYGPKSWSSDPNVWEMARESLAKLISAHR